MLTEEILHKVSRTGTTVFYFAPNVTSDQAPELQDPAYVVFGAYNIPIVYGTFASGGTELWRLENTNGYNNNVLISPIPPISVIVSGSSATTYISQTNPNALNYVTGYSITQTFNTLMSESQRETIRQRFNDDITNTITAQTNVAVNHPTYVFFKEQEIDDMFASIKLSRSYETLDTLKIYNSPINSIPTQEAQTGVLFGKLEALQPLKNELGDSIRIPLRNVPIGIFNVSDEFPTPMSLNGDGNRFFMNLKEASFLNQYFDSVAFDEDNKVLNSGSGDTVVPDKFKYITLTNDNGEFVIYNAPVGNQVVVFEVDLYKQGLTKDEIILNYFPFPADDSSAIGEFPSYYYNQIPVEVVPAWGTIQTGYTELDITAHLDLRKWTTYIFAPATYGNEKLEASVAKNNTNTFKIQIRDMTSKNFAVKILETTQISSDLDRRPGAKYLWYNEILAQRQQLEYFQFGCHVLKLPANLYDPEGFRTDINGNPTTQKGLWLSAYQFRTFIDKNVCLRDSGGYFDGTNFFSHFGLSFTPALTDTTEGSGIGTFPYEKPWSLTYPEPYKIPPKPVQTRYVNGNQRTFQNPFILEEPAYADGDLVGNPVFGNNGAIAGGFGVQAVAGEFISNQIAYVATNTWMWKYERGVTWNETYANGYQPAFGPYDGTAYQVLENISSVNNGEKYQRVECGYGYFMKYQNWPKIYRVDWGADIYFHVVSSPLYSPAGIYGSFKALQDSVSQVYNLDDQNYAFAFDKSIVHYPTSHGGIDIYRILDSGIGNISPIEALIIPTSVVLNFGSITRLNSLKVTNSGTVAAKIVNQFGYQTNTYLQIYNPSNGPEGLPIGPNQQFTLNPGYSFSVINDVTNDGPPQTCDLQIEVRYSSIILPGNDDFDPGTHKYNTARYLIQGQINNPGGFFGSNTPDASIIYINGVHYSTFSRTNPGPTYGTPADMPATVSPTNYYVNTFSIDGGGTGHNRFGVTTMNPQNNNNFDQYVMTTIELAQGIPD